MRIFILYFLIVAIVPLFPGSATEAQQVRRYQKNGVTYEETRRTERKPVAKVQWHERQETVYVQQASTEVREYQRTIYTPVVKYHCEPRWHNTLNPFGTPYVAYHMRPSVEWQMRNEIVQTPVTCQRWVPQNRVVKTPTRSLGFVQQETVSVARILPSGPATQMANRQTSLDPRGHYVPMAVSGRPAPNVSVGVRRMEGDPPRGTTLR